MQVRDEKISSLIKKLAQKKSKIEHREKVLKEKERKLKIRRYIEIGVIAAKFGIDQWDDMVLTGIFAEIQELSKANEAINLWKKKGEELSKTALSPLIVSSENEFPEATKDTLKKRKFKWNSFRKEWYGYGLKEEIEELVKICDGQVDIAKG